MKPFVLILLIGCGGAPTAGVLAPVEVSSTSTGQHAIVLHRTPVLGASFTVTLTGQSRVHTVVSIGGQLAQDTDVQRSITMVAEVRVQEMNAQGKPTLTEFTILSCQHGETNAELLPPGSVVVVRAVAPPAEGSITLQGGELSEEQTKVLDLVVSTHASGRNDDDIFGTTIPRTVGESWPMNAELAAADLSEVPNLHVEAAGMNGRTTFESLGEVEGTMCQNMRAELTAENIQFEGLPEGAVIQRSSFVGNMTTSLPLEASAGRVRSGERMTMTLAIEFPTPNGQASMQIDTTMAKTMIRQP